MTSFLFVVLSTLSRAVSEDEVLSGPLQKEAARNVSAILDSLLHDYDRSFRPGLRTDEPVKVVVTIAVLSIGPILDTDMQFSIDCYFRQSWVDERLSFEGSQSLSLNAVEFLKRIWKPDTYVKNGRDSYLHKITVPNRLLRLSPDGNVLISQRLTIKAHCPMHLKKFPMDTQVCPLIIGSLGYPSGDMFYLWDNVTVAAGLQLSQYKLVSYMMANWTFRTKVAGVAENFSTVVVHFKLQRQQGYYLLQVYIPCMMSVALSWVSFWIHKEASPARVSLGVMTVLTMYTLSLGGRGVLPRISYSTGMDIYIMACFGFVFAALVEYAIINFANQLWWKQRMQKQVAMLKKAMAQATANLGRLQQPRLSGDGDGDFDNSLVATVTNEAHALNAFKQFQRRRRAMSNAQGASKEPSFVSNNSEDEEETDVAANENIGGSKYKRYASGHSHTMVDTIDDWAKVLFPLTYILFNAIYWALYLVWLPDEVEPDWDRNSRHALLYHYRSPE